MQNLNHQDKEFNPTPDRFWFKVFNEVLHEMVFIDMPDAMLGVYVRLLALANSTRTVGLIPGDVSAVVRALRLESTEAGVECLRDLERLGLIFIEEGIVGIADERHFEGKGLTPSQSREAQNDRQRKRRAKVKAEGDGRQQTMRSSHSDRSPGIEEVDHSTAQSSIEKTSKETMPNRGEYVDVDDYMPGDPPPTNGSSVDIGDCPLL